MSPQLAEIMQQAEGLSSAEQLQLIAHLAQRLSAVPPAWSAMVTPAVPEEARLLERIYQAVSPELQSRYDELSAKLRAEEISPEEHQDLLKLTHRVEKADGERLKALVALAKCRNISLPQLMQDLKLQPPPLHV